MFENKQICRTCLTSERELLSIFASVETGTRIADYFSLYLNHSLYENDGLPQKICRQCVDKILGVKKFYRQCRDSEEHLRRQMKKVTSSTTEIIGLYKIEPLFEENEIKSKEVSEISEIEGFSCEETNSDDIIEYAPLETITFPLDDETSFVDVEEEPLEVEEFKCSLCDETFKYEKNLRMHKKLDHNDEEIEKSRSENTNSPSDTSKGDINPTNDDGRIQVEPYHCDQCDCNFRFRRNYEIHMRRHGKPSKYRCSKCRKTFFSKSMKVEHFNQVHLKRADESCLCSTCGAHFNTRKNLLKHMQIHREDRKRYPCHICEKTFLGKNGLASHLRTHTGEKPFQCDICLKRFTQGNALVTHMTLHTGKTVKCPLCDKCFSRPSFLKIHNREHTDEKPYACDICPKRYRQKSHLVAHQYTHFGEKSFSCETCGKCFTQKSSLREHMFKHIGRPYKCPACELTFIRPFKLGEHLVSAHGIYDDPIKYKQQCNTNSDELKEGEEVILEADLVEVDGKDIEIDITL